MTNEAMGQTDQGGGEAWAGVDVFLSYPRTERSRASLIAKALHDAGLHVFWDIDISPGRSWLPALEQALQQARAVLVLIGPEGLRSWQKREVELALRLRSSAGVLVVPARLPDAPISTGFLGNIQHFDLPSGEPTEVTIAELIRLLTARGEGSTQRRVRVSLAADKGADPLLKVLPQKDGHLCIGSYLLKERVGSGAFGTVWRAEHQILGQARAVKILHSNRVSENRQFVELIHRGAKLAANLSHPNAVTIFDAGSDAGFHYVSMEFVDGQSVRDVVEHMGPMPILEAVETARSIASALAAAHAGGIVHRDLKPENVLLSTGGTVKVVDFDLAKLVDRETHLTLTRGEAGTPAYMAPEQWEPDGHVGAAADVWALGAVLYFLLTGKDAIRAKTLEQAWNLVRRGLPDVRKVRPEVPRGVSALIARAARRAHVERPTMDQMFWALGALAQALPREEARRVDPQASASVLLRLRAWVRRIFNGDRDAASMSEREREIQELRDRLSEYERRWLEGDQTDESVSAEIDSENQRLRDRIRELEQGLSNQVQGDDHRKQVDALERRVRKLADMLEMTEAELRRVSRLKDIDPGIASVYRAVQGLSDDERDYEVRKQLMNEIFKANIELRERRLASTDGPPLRNEIVIPRPPSGLVPTTSDFGGPAREGTASRTPARSTEVEPKKPRGIGVTVFKESAPTPEAIERAYKRRLEILQENFDSERERAAGGDSPPT